jgi:hypothetical protein
MANTKKCSENACIHILRALSDFSAVRCVARSTWLIWAVYMLDRLLTRESLEG